MTDAGIGMLLVAVAFGVVLIGGLLTRTMLLLPLLSFTRDQQPTAFWIAAAANAALAVLALWAAFP
jgi:hypothetical protein